jgi:hypothetical protein
MSAILATDLDRLADELRATAGRLRAGEPLAPVLDDSPLGRRLAELALVSDLLTRSGVADLYVNTGSNGVDLNPATIGDLRALLDAAGWTAPTDLHARPTSGDAWHVGGPDFARHNGIRLSIYAIVRTAEQRAATRAWLAPLGVAVPADEPLEMAA